MQIKETGINLYYYLLEYFIERCNEELVINHCSVLSQAEKEYLDDSNHSLYFLFLIDFDIDPTTVWCLSSLAKVILRIEQEVQKIVKVKLSNKGQL